MSTAVASAWRSRRAALIAALVLSGLASLSTAVGQPASSTVPGAGAAVCSPSPTALCLQGSRFKVEALWTASAGGPLASATAVPITGDTGYFWFFDAANIEMVVKVLDGCGINGHFWVFAGGLTDVQVRWTVTDAQTSQVRTYESALGAPFAPVQDTAAFACSSPVAYDWRQFDFDAGHSGNNPLETRLSRANVASLQRLFAVRLPEIADGAPALAAGVASASGTSDLLFVTTKAGRLVALDASNGATVWATQPPAGPRYTTSSPAIDPGRQFVYGYGLDGLVHKYAVASGLEVMSGGWPQLATLKPDVEKGSSALAVATARSGVSYLYALNGGYPGDAGDYQGHVTAIRLTDGAQKVFNANCSDRTVHFVENGDSSTDCPHVQSAIWARVGAVYDGRTDRIYMATGNGDFDGNAGGHDWGDTVFALTPDGAGAGGNPVDTYTPANFQHLQDTDADLGSTAPALLPVADTRVVSALGLQSGKDATLRLLNLSNLSGQGIVGQVGGELQTLPVPQGGQVLTAPAVWVNPADGTTWTFVANSAGISGLQLIFDASGHPSLASRWAVGAGGSSPIVANGMVFYAGNNRISALDPTTGSILWSDSAIGAIHWESPIVANGALYITDENGMLTAYTPNGLPLSGAIGPAAAR